MRSDGTSKAGPSMEYQQNCCAYCGYCGKPFSRENPNTRDHVFPQNLFPPQRRRDYSPIIVPAHENCNGRWSDDEAHFRNVVNCAGWNQPAEELYHSKIKRSLQKCDGYRRIQDLWKISEKVDVDGETRLKIYPARDPRVLGVIRKFVIGLCHHHKLLTALDPQRIFADVLRFDVPPEHLAVMGYHHCEADIAEYWYEVVQRGDVHSEWLFRFNERIGFVAVVNSA